MNTRDKNADQQHSTTRVLAAAATGILAGLTRALVDVIIRHLITSDH